MDWKDPLEESMETHSSIHAQRIAWTEKPGRFSGVEKSQTRLKWLSTRATGTGPSALLLFVELADLWLLLWECCPIAWFTTSSLTPACPVTALYRAALWPQGLLPGQWSPFCKFWYWCFQCQRWLGRWQWCNNLDKEWKMSRIAIRILIPERLKLKKKF